MLTHKIKYRVIYGDTDNMGFVYYANYLRWFEKGRTEMFRFLGLTYRAIEEKGIFLPVSEVFCKYLQPVRYDDVVVIETSLDESVKGGMKFDYRLFKEGDADTVIATGHTKHACLDKSGKVVRPPGFIRELIKGPGK